MQDVLRARRTFNCGQGALRARRTFDWVQDVLRARRTFNCGQGALRARRTFDWVQDNARVMRVHAGHYMASLPGAGCTQDSSVGARLDEIRCLQAQLKPI